jgi:hypothetical protein
MSFIMIFSTMLHLPSPEDTVTVLVVIILFLLFPHRRKNMMVVAVLVGS